MAQDTRTPTEPPVMIPAGSRVVLVVSRGAWPTTPAQTVSVPKMVGGDQGAALSALQEAGLEAQVFNDFSDSYKRGVVMGQVPSAGTYLPPGAQVALLVSSGGAVSHTMSVPLPNVVGKEEPQAVGAVEAGQLSPQIVRDYSDTVAAGTVMAQMPDREWVVTLPARRSNWWVWALTAVLFIGVGILIFFLTGARGVEVPNVIGRTQAQAISQIQAAELNVGAIEGTVTAEVAEGMVASQTPAGGQRAPKESEVTIWVAAAKPLVEVPNVTGMTQSAAEGALRNAGLGIAVQEAANADAAPGTVFSQSPPAGERVPDGTPVAISVAVANAPKLVVVPSLAGRNRSSVESLLGSLGLVAVIVDNPSPTVAEGIVSGQYPPPMFEMLPGGTVGVTASSGAPEDASTLAVPEVIGQQTAAAQGLLSDAGLESQLVDFAGRQEPEGEVVAVLPAQGTSVSPGSSVILFVSTGP